MAPGGLSRRRLVRGMAAGAGLTAAGIRPAFASTADHAGMRLDPVGLAPGTRPDPSKPEGEDCLPQIEHIVIYMQENHSFDNYFGMLGKGDGLTLGGDGLPTNSNPDANGNPVLMHRNQGTCQIDVHVSQNWNNSHKQLDGGLNDGFVQSTNETSMGYWTGQELPYYYALANAFPVCDRWFTSVLGQTFPNRRYLQAATSMGIVSTNANEVLATPSAPNGVIWDRLNAHGISWADYAFDLPDILLFPDFYKTDFGKIRTYNQFLLDCAAGTLPAVSIVSPGNDIYTEENPHDIGLGEAYSAAVINAVMQSPNWGSTALFFLYDEHGGYYDHVPPPAAFAPDSIAPRIAATDFQAGFDQYGFRVPAVVVSPFAKPGYVSSVVHDHTSILKFIETKFNLGALTYRDANADNLFDCFDFTQASFPEPPDLPDPGILAAGASACSPDTPLPQTVGIPEEPPTTVPTTEAPTTAPTTVPPETTAPSTAPGSTAAPTTVPGGTATGGTTGSSTGTYTTSGGFTYDPTDPSSYGNAPLARTGAPSNTKPLLVGGGLAVLSGVAFLMAQRQLQAAERPIVVTTEKPTEAPAQDPPTD